MRSKRPALFTRNDSIHKMTIKFTKMHGLGNDFIVIDAINQTMNWTAGDIAKLSRRDTGIGFDQCLLLEASMTPGIDFFYRIFNANGQEVGQCGNGARCLARFARQYGLTQKNTLTVATRTTQMTLHINPDETVTVDMGKPKLNPKDIPIRASNQAVYYTIPLKQGQTCEVQAISVGNPHVILLVSDIKHAPVSALGIQISQHAKFPEQTNVGFMEIETPEHVYLRVYERGCGETQACGSGAVAAMAIGRLYHQLSETVKVSLPGGDLIVQWKSTEQPLFLTGPAAFVYEGMVI